VEPDGSSSAHGRWLGPLLLGCLAAVPPVHERGVWDITALAVVTLGQLGAELVEPFLTPPASRVAARWDSAARVRVGL
jgi:hypothetical protein